MRGEHQPLEGATANKIMRNQRSNVKLEVKAAAALLNVRNGGLSTMSLSKREGGTSPRGCPGSLSYQYKQWGERKSRREIEVAATPHEIKKEAGPAESLIPDVFRTERFMPLNNNLRAKTYHFAPFGNKCWAVKCLLSGQLGK